MNAVASEQRICEQDDCGTVLSSYNPSTYCAVHERERAEGRTAAARPRPPSPDPPAPAEPPEEERLSQPEEVDPDAVEAAVLDLLTNSEIGLLKRELWNGVSADLQPGVVDALDRLRASGRVMTTGRSSATRFHLPEQQPSDPDPQPSPANIDALVVEALKRAGIALSRREIEERTGANLNTLSDVLARLRADGAIVMVGQKSASKYRLPEGEYEAESDDESAAGEADEADPVGEARDEPEPGEGAGPEVGGPLTRRDEPPTRARLDDYAEMIALLRDVYAHGYDRYLTALIEYFEETHAMAVADRIEKMLDAMIGWCE